MGFIIFVIIVVFLVSQNNQKNKEENNALSEERDTPNSNKLESVVLDTQEKGWDFTIINDIRLFVNCSG